jgi:Fe-S-cluster containining protein
VDDRLHVRAFASGRGSSAVGTETAGMQEIDLIANRELRNLRRFTRATGQPASLDGLDLEPMSHVKEIEITDEHITIQYNETVKRRYNANEITHREWVYKYNDDPDMVAAIARVIELSRKHLYDLPENISCPPGCAECCSGYEPFVNRADVQRIADHLGLTYDEVMRDYVVARESADGYVVGWLRKVSDDVTDKCVFLKGPRSGKYYCGIYEARPYDCRDFTPVGCQDVDTNLPREGTYPVGPPFTPKRRSTKRLNGR